MAGTTRKTGGSFTESDADGGWIEHRGDAYRYQVYLTGSAGRFRAIAATVPNVTADGRTEEEALANIQTALADLLRAKKATGEAMPRAELTPPPGSLSRYVIVRLAQ